MGDRDSEYWKHDACQNAGQVKREGRQAEEEEAKSVCYMSCIHCFAQCRWRRSRCANDFRMCHQELKDLLTLLSSHQLAIPDACNVYMCWHDACTCHHWASQWSATSLINSCIRHTPCDHKCPQHVRTHATRMLMCTTACCRVRHGTCAYGVPIERCHMTANLPAMCLKPFAQQARSKSRLGKPVLVTTSVSGLGCLLRPATLPARCFAARGLVASCLAATCKLC